DNGLEDRKQVLVGNDAPDFTNLELCIHSAGNHYLSHTCILFWCAGPAQFPRYRNPILVSGDKGLIKKTEFQVKSCDFRLPRLRRERTGAGCKASDMIQICFRAGLVNRNSLRYSNGFMTLA